MVRCDRSGSPPPIPNPPSGALKFPSAGQEERERADSEAGFCERRPSCHGLPRAGFQPAADTVTSWRSRTWTETNHDLDRVFVRDGIAYGLEIKNRLSYIDWNEFQTKLSMCLYLELKPLFVARMMPKTYIQQVREAGGFCLLMGRQFYPIALAELATQVKNDLGLPVDTPARLEDGTLNRLLNWHKTQISTDGVGDMYS
jgi:hypothetical protein